MNLMIGFMQASCSSTEGIQTINMKYGREKGTIPPPRNNISIMRIEEEKGKLLEWHICKYLVKPLKYARFTRFFKPRIFKT